MANRIKIKRGDTVRLNPRVAWANRMEKRWCRLQREFVVKSVRREKGTTMITFDISDIFEGRYSIDLLTKVNA